MGRRRFMRHSAAGVALAASSDLTWAAESLPRSQPGDKADDWVVTRAEVLVVGGGTAGTIAALQAARAGAKTIRSTAPMVPPANDEIAATVAWTAIEIDLNRAEGVSRFVGAMKQELVTRRINTNAIDELDDVLDDLHYTYIQTVIHEARSGDMDPQQSLQLALIGEMDPKKALMEANKKISRALKR